MDRERTALICPYFTARETDGKRICGNCEMWLTDLCNSFLSGELLPPPKEKRVRRKRRLRGKREKVDADIKVEQLELF